jgi:hypothetical protein
LTLVKHDTCARRSIDFTMPKIHSCHRGPGEDLHLSLVDRILKVPRHQVPNNKSKIWLENLTCLWINTDRPKVLEIKRGIP